MHSNNLAPMAGGSDHHEVICIEAKRVCDFCFQEQRVERTFTPPVTPTTATPMITCTVDEMNITCREVERREVDARRNQFLVCLAITVPVRITIDNNPAFTQNITFLKQAILCAPAGTDVECQVTGDCCCFFDTTTMMLNCVFNFCVVIQTKATVRVLIQTLGNCAPKQCQSVVAGCPPGMMNPCENCSPIGSSRDSSGC